MWSKIVGLFSKADPRDTPPSSREILEEISNLKKGLRKQTAFLDLFRKEVAERLEEKRVKEVVYFIELAEAFFHHDRSLREISDLSSNQRDALEIVWQKLEALLTSVGIQVVRKVDVHFDSRLHEAMEKLAEGNGSPVVKRILQPGFVHEGRVVKPAKVMIERENCESKG
jgi:molecular chaperone GrpE (heat shock protein)